MTTLRYRVALACMALGLALPRPPWRSRIIPTTWSGDRAVRRRRPDRRFHARARRELRKSLKQGFVMENRPGAGTVIGTAEGAKSPPDGYTLVMVSATQTSTRPWFPTSRIS